MTEVGTLKGRYFQDRFLESWYPFVEVTSCSVLGPSVEPPSSIQVLSSDSSAAHCACLHKQASSLQIRVLGLILVGQTFCCLGRVDSVPSTGPEPEMANTNF